jgi:multidrug efflux pump subunit AcrA (membrane-fusion protein)
VRRRNGETTVFVVAGSKAERRTVTVEESARGDECIVRSGLTAGERVIVAAPESLKAGDLIREK